MSAKREILSKAKFGSKSKFEADEPPIKDKQEQEGIPQMNDKVLNLQQWKVQVDIKESLKLEKLYVRFEKHEPTMLISKIKAMSLT